MKEIKVFKVNSRQHRSILFETNLSSNRDTDLTTPAKNKEYAGKLAPPPPHPPGGEYSTNVDTGRLCPEVQPLTLLINLYTIFRE